MAALRKPWRGPGSSDRYMEGTWVILAARASLPMTILPLAGASGARGVDADGVQGRKRAVPREGAARLRCWRPQGGRRGQPYTPQRGMWWLPIEMHTFLISANTS
ncbi:hypothetical protein D3C86_1864840 [compost metagenome]